MRLRVLSVVYEFAWEAVLYLLFLCGRDCVSLTVLFTDKSWRELGVGKKQDDF